MITSSIPVDVNFIINVTNQMIISYKLELDRKDKEIKILKEYIKNK